MTRAKKLKKAIRARSSKTGESYTAARRQVLRARRPRPEPKAPAPRPPSPPAAAPKARTTRGGPSEDNIVKTTGHGFDHWFAVLDRFGAGAKGHTASARHLYDAHGVPGWHAQGITVAYERARGLRAVNQACTGGFQVSISRVVPASAAEVVSVLARPEKRAAWLKLAEPTLRDAMEAAFKGPKPRQVKVKDDNNAHLRYPWGDGTTVELRITGKPASGKSSVSVGNMDLPSPEAVEVRRALWAQALDGLRAHLSR
jgi:hypothetical protein